MADFKLANDVVALQEERVKVRGQINQLIKDFQA